MNKILIIGQAPPAVKQTVPYDTTMLYDMFLWVGISKEEAQSRFEFEALVSEFPGFDENGHKPPTKENILKHFPFLYYKADIYKKVIALGRMAANEWSRSDFYTIGPSRLGSDIHILCLPHPSKRNYSMIMDKKDKIVNCLNEFLKPV